MDMGHIMTMANQFIINGIKKGYGKRYKNGSLKYEVILLMINMMERVHYMILQVFILENGNVAKKLGMEKNIIMKEIITRKLQKIFPFGNESFK